MNENKFAKNFSILIINKNVSKTARLFLVFSKLINNDEKLSVSLEMRVISLVFLLNELFLLSVKDNYCADHKKVLLEIEIK